MKELLKTLHTSENSNEIELLLPFTSVTNIEQVYKMCLEEIHN